MECPRCKSADSRVVDSRTTGDLIRRRRECGDCQFRFTTYERVERRIPWILKRDDRREPYSREKLLRGLTLACRKRPLCAEDIEGVVTRVEAWLETHTQPDVTSVDLGRAVLKELREVDPVAYVRFSSVYLAFESVEQFIQVIAPLREETG